MNNIQQKSYIIVTHYLIYSASQALRDFLKSCNTKLLYISHPLPGIETEKKEYSYAEKSKKGNIIKKSTAPIRFRGLFFTIIYELLLTFSWILTFDKKYDLYIGVDNINAFYGIVLKKLGIVKKVVYYTIDYFPTRYSNKTMNNLYHWVDKFCVKNADETWNVSSQMILAREIHNNMNKKIYNSQFTVPIGVWFDKTKRLPFSKINRNKIVFVGHLVKHMGVELIIRALPILIKKIPNIEIAIVGGGEELENLKNISKKLHVEKNVTFYGWVRNRKKMEKILSDGALGLATFNTEILDAKVMNADPMKIKDYMLLGMPVIVTNAVLAGKKISSQKAGILIPYLPTDLAKAILYLLEDEKRLEKYRQNAVQYVKQFDYTALFRENLARILAK